jgi:hypothetical protein
MMATTTGHRLTLDPMRKCSNAFFSETTNQTESKLDRNVLIKDLNFVEDHPMIILWQFDLNCPSGFREEAF